MLTFLRVWSWASGGHERALLSFLKGPTLPGYDRHGGASGAALFLPNTDFFNGQSVLPLKLLSLTKALSPNSAAI